MTTDSRSCGKGGTAIGIGASTGGGGGGILILANSASGVDLLRLDT